MNYDGLKTFGAFLIVIAVVGLIVVVGPSACTSPDRATRVLQQSGYRDIKLTGYRPFMKSDSDFYSTGFEATAPNGQRVTGAVTGGLLKGSTIRFD